MTSIRSISLVACLLTAAVQSQNVVANIDCGNGGNAFVGQGVVPATGNFWNAFGGFGSNLLAPDGSTATGITVDIAGASTATYGNANKMLGDYVYASVFARYVGNLSITGLQPNTDYLFYVYSAGDKIDQAGVITLEGVTKRTSGSLSSGYSEGLNYVVFELRTGASGSIAGNWKPLNTDGAINGMQIVEGTLPARVRDIEGSEGLAVRLPGATIPVTVDFGETVALSQIGGATLELNLGGVVVTATQTGPTVSTSLVFEGTVPSTLAQDVTDAFVVANSLQLVNGAMLTDAFGDSADLRHGEITLPNDQVSVQRLSVYSPVPGLSESSQYRFRVREVGGAWQSSFAWFTKCTDFPDPKYGYYADQIGGWSHTYCNFEMAEGVPIEVEITRLDPATLKPVDITSAVPHPRRKVQSWRVEGGKAYVRLERPALFAVDIDRQHDDYITPNPRRNEKALHGVSVFANPFLLNKPDVSDPSVRTVAPGDPVPDDGNWTTLYFEPGIHQLHAGKWAFGSEFMLRGNRSYYIPGNAIVHGNMNNGNDASNAERVRIFGHGTLSGERMEHPIELGILTLPQQKQSSPIRVSAGAKGCRVDGVTLADPAFHALSLEGGYNGRREDFNVVRWAKVIGWRANTDGISPNGSGFVEDCFLRVQDDGSYVAGLGIRRMVYWHDVNGMPLRCSQLLKHNDAAFFEDSLLVEDIDVIYARTFFGSGPERSVIGYPSPDTRFTGATGSHVVFRDVQVEDLHPTRLLFGWGLDVPGADQPVSGVMFENVRAAARNLDRETDVFVGGVGAPIANLTFENVAIGGEQFASSADFVTNGFVTGLIFNNALPETRIYRNTSGYGKWYLNDDWDGSVEPANNDIVEHTAVAAVLTVDASAYAGDLKVGHSGIATVSVDTVDGRLTVAGTLAVGTTGIGRVELLGGSLRLEDNVSTALTFGAGVLHIEKGELVWAGDHISDIQALQGTGLITFAEGRESLDGVLPLTLIAQIGLNSLYAAYDAVEDETRVFAFRPPVYGSGCGAPGLTFTPDALGRPVIGQTVTATVANAPLGTGGAILGLTKQQTPLDIIGMPGCFLLQSAEIFGLPVTRTGPTTMHYRLDLPSDPTLVGQRIHLQAFAFAPGVNSLGLISSNGIAWTIGD